MPENMFNPPEECPASPEDNEAPVVLGVIFGLRGCSYVMRRTSRGTLLIMGGVLANGRPQPALETPWGCETADWVSLIARIAVHCDMECVDVARLMGPLVETSLALEAIALVEALKAVKDLPTDF